MEGFIYILSEKTYYDELKSKGLYRHMPDLLLKKIENKLKARVLVEFKNKDDIIGYGIGLNIDKKLDKNELLDRIKQLLKDKLEIDKLNSIVYEENYNLELTRKLIEEGIIYSTNLSRNVKLKTIVNVLGELINNIDGFNDGVELLIIPEKEDDMDIINGDFLANVKVISIYNENTDITRNIFSKVMNNTGLSTEVIRDKSKIQRFDIIINFTNDMDFVKCVKKKSIVFNIYDNLLYERNPGIIIEDFMFINSNVIESDNEKINIEEEIPSYLYAYKENYDLKDFRKIRVGKKLYSIKEFHEKYNQEYKYSSTD